MSPTSPGPLPSRLSMNRHISVVLAAAVTIAAVVGIAPTFTIAGPRCSPAPVPCNASRSAAGPALSSTTGVATVDCGKTRAGSYTNTNGVGADGSVKSRRAFFEARSSTLARCARRKTRRSCDSSEARNCFKFAAVIHFDGDIDRKTNRICGILLEPNAKAAHSAIRGWAASSTRKTLLWTQPKPGPNHALHFPITLKIR